MSVPPREEFAKLVDHHTATAKKLAFTGDEVVRFADERVSSAAALLAAYDSLVAERDAKAEEITMLKSDRESLEIANAQHATYTRKLAAERDEWKRRAEALGYQGGK